MTTPEVDKTGLGRVLKKARELATRPDRAAVTGRRAGVAVLLLLAFTQGVGLSFAELIQGVSLGALYGLLGIALVLVYRTSRIINFAAGAIGAIPAITALLLVTQLGVSYLVALPVALLGGPLVGALTDVVVMRHFAKSPRLIVTVVTIGLAQSFAVVGFFLPVWFGADLASPPQVDTPWQQLSIDNDRGQPVLTGNQVFAFVVVLGLTLGLSAFLRRSRLGIALRASAENADRAGLLGIPVERIGTAAWALAGLLGSMAIFAQAPLIGIPNDATLGFSALLYGLAAAVVGRMEKFGLTLAAGTVIGVIIFASVSKTGTNDLAAGLMLLLILGALLVQRASGSRALDSGVSSFQSVQVFRPIPAELRRLPEIVRLRALGYLTFAGVVVALPFVVGEANLPLLQTLPLFGIVAVSLVVLTGWAGQISLGQFGLVGIAAAVSGGLVARHNIDFFVAIAIGVAVGAAAAVVIGLPAIRIQGLYLAVTTLAFGIAVQAYVLNPNYAVGSRLLPDQYNSTLLRPVLYGRINLENEKNFYFVCLTALVLSVLCALAFRKNYSGRTVIAMRDNQRAAASYAINPVRTRLSAFAVAGGFAGLAGVLFSYAQYTVTADTYSVRNSITVFLLACIAGLTSVWAAAVGVMLLQGFTLFGPELWNALLADHPTITSVIPLLLTGPLLVYNLYTLPGGQAQIVFDARDNYLRKLAHRYNIQVPSLLADKRVDQQADRALSRAEQVQEQREEELSVAASTLACPVCQQRLDPSNLSTHEHLMVEEPVR